MNLRNLILILAALVVAGGTAYVARGMLVSQSAPPVSAKTPVEEPAKKVLVAKVNLAAGVFVKEEDLSWQKWPTDGINENYIVQEQGDINAIVGAVVRKGIVAGSPVTAAQVARPGDRGFLAAVLAPGMRAITVGVSDASGISGLVFPGDRVDVILNMTFDLEKESGDTADGEAKYRQSQTAETVLENVRVLATDRRLDDLEGEARDTKNVTIELTPKQVEIIRLANAMGALSLSLRGLATEEPNEPAQPSVASMQTTAMTPDLFAAAAQDMPEAPAAEESAPGLAPVFGDDPPATRGDSFTFDVEVSRPMVELMNPGESSVQITVIHGSAGGDARIEQVLPH